MRERERASERVGADSVGRGRREGKGRARAQRLPMYMQVHALALGCLSGRKEPAAVLQQLPRAGLA